MDTRIVLVPSDSSVLTDGSTIKLHVYPNGDVLVRTAAAVTEEGESDETPVKQGLRIAGATDAELSQARSGLGAVAGNGKTKTPVVETVRVADPAETTFLGYVEFIGPTDPAWLDAIRKAGIEPLRYHPENTFLCKAPDTASFNRITKLDFVLTVTLLTDALKPKMGRMAEDGEDAQIIVEGSRDQANALMRQFSALAGVEIDGTQQVEQVDFFLRIRARVRPEGQAALLKDRRVVAVEHFEAPHPEDEVANLIVCGQYDLPGKPNGSYLKWLEDYGINGSGVTIGIVDAGVDVTHAAFAGRIKDLVSGRKSWHGTFVAGHAAGAYLSEKDANQFIYGIGLAPAANILVQDNALPATTLCQQTVTERGPSGMAGLVQNNSWGKGTQDPMDYSSDEAAYDKLVRNADPDGATPRPITVCFSSGNSGQSGLTRPKAAKNVIITGNSENYRPDVGKDQSDNIHEVYTGPHPSSWGNCGDGRIRPHVVAPGEWTSSANYDSHPGEAEYISPQLTWGGGSSGASPKTTAACALLIQWWRNHQNGVDPSPALLRALVVNGAEPMLTGGTIPNNVQGWGRLNLGNIVNQNTAFVYSDQESLLKQLGDETVWNIVVADPAKPLKITLAWTDPPGPIGSGGQPTIPTIVNKLALRAQVGGKTYRANQFQQGWSIAGTSAAQEGLDNLQNIFINVGEATGAIKVSVTGLNITTNCLTGLVDTPQQDFALVISNAKLDGSRSPLDVAVAVDNAASGDAKPGSPGDYWSNQPGSSDNAHVEASWWNSTDSVAPVPDSNEGTQPIATPVASDPNEVNNWWSQVDQVWGTQPETEKAPLTSNRAFADALTAGIDITAGAGGHVAVGPETPTAEAVRITGKSSQEAGALSAVQLPSALGKLIEAWKTSGHDVRTGTAKRRAAVLVVGSGTRVSAQDIDLMKKATILGELYLVSSDPSLLSFLAQRIHRMRGVQFRLAQNREDLAQTARDALVEAAGLQQVAVTPLATSGKSSQWNFHLVDADLKCVVQVTYDPKSRLTGLRLTGPGKVAAMTILPKKTNGPEVVERPGFLQITLPKTSAKSSWAGAWQVEAKSSDFGPAHPILHVWADSRLQFRVIKAAAGDEAQDKSLIVLSGSEGITFRGCVIKAPRIATKVPRTVSEDERDTVLTVPVSRLDRSSGKGVQAETEKAQAMSPQLSHWVRWPEAKESASVLHLVIEARGADALGHAFERILHHNLIRLEPRSVWRKRISSGTEKVLMTSAVIEDLEYSSGQVVSVRLRRGAQERQVNVQAPLLREQLARLHLPDLRRKSCGVFVAGSELVSFFLWLDRRSMASSALMQRSHGG